MQFFQELYDKNSGEKVEDMFLFISLHLERICFSLSQDDYRLLNSDNFYNM